MQGLNILLSRYSHLLVLRALYHTQTPLSGREIERRTGLSNRATMMALDYLVEQAAVLFTEQTNAHQYALNRNHYFVMKALKPAFEAEDLFWTDFRKAVRRHVHPYPIAAVATGPLARDEYSLNLKIELTMLFATGRHRIRAFSCMDALAEAVWMRYAASVEPVLLDLNTMDQDKYDTLWRRVAREGVLLFGSLP
jgi:hypothetical protein